MNDREKAEMIVDFLRRMNDGWLRKKLDSQKVWEREEMIEKLSAIIGGWK